MAIIILRFLPLLLLVIALLLLWNMAKRKQLNNPVIWYVWGLLAVSIIGGGLVLFFTDESPKRPHTITPTQYKDGKIIRGKPE